MHDEKTVELEIPGTSSNVVRFPSATANQTAPTTKAPAATVPTERRANWFQSVDLGAPWVLRLVAVIAIIILSMLVL